MFTKTACVMDIAIIQASVYHSMTASSGYRSIRAGLYATRFINNYNYFHSLSKGTA